MIAIVDYGMGNLRSVSKALEKLGAQVAVTSDPDVIRNAEKIVLPGVGAFGDAMCELRKRNLIKPIKEAIEKNKPFLGICLGLQLLFKSSEENPGVPGLGVFPGTVVRFPNAAGLKVPHMGWNNVQLGADRETLMSGVKDGGYFYFVHSYYAKPDDASLIQGSTDYGVRFAAIIGKQNVWATQFHPEKSQSEGLKILENFVKLKP
ncbi:MAG: imidazole glycerol phosphate synthase subunit HisH [Candidatus Omnitrophica bacterium]|nr:imidazole glycerol phosphate synthase subunit HisH [Candidatus Omnitrophota bacterium]